MQVKNEKICINLEEKNLSSNCLEVENINTEEKPLYSCSKWSDDFTSVILKTNGVKNCYEREKNQGSGAYNAWHSSSCCQFLFFAYA